MSKRNPEQTPTKGTVDQSPKTPSKRAEKAPQSPSKSVVSPLNTAAAVPSGAPQNDGVGEGEEKIGAFKKLFMLGRMKVANVKPTEFSAEYLAILNALEVYSTHMRAIMIAFYHIVQENPDINTDARLSSPPGDDPYERLHKYLEAYAAVVGKSKLTEVMECSKRLSTLHRNFQKNSRKLLHFTRTFLKVDIENYHNEHAIALERRQAMDYSRYEHDNSPNMFRQIMLNRRTKAYEEQCRKTMNLYQSVPDKQMDHRIEILRFLQELRSYHHSTAKEFAKITPILAKLPEISAVSPPRPHEAVQVMNLGT